MGQHSLPWCSYSRRSWVCCALTTLQRRCCSHRSCMMACVLRLSCHCSQTNSVSFSSALHTAARHAHERSSGQELLKEVLEGAPLSLLVQATQRHYLPVHTAARTGDRAALQAIVSCMLSVLARLNQNHLMQVRQAEQGAGYKCDKWTSHLHASTHTGLLVCE